jgi:hypothetical protein
LCGPSSLKFSPIHLKGSKDFAEITPAPEPEPAPKPTPAEDAPGDATKRIRDFLLHALAIETQSQ